jgi:hypothetical protein
MPQKKLKQEKLQTASKEKVNNTLTRLAINSSQNHLHKEKSVIAMHVKAHYQQINENTIHHSLNFIIKIINYLVINSNILLISLIFIFVLTFFYQNKL